MRLQRLVTGLRNSGHDSRSLLISHGFRSSSDESLGRVRDRLRRLGYEVTAIECGVAKRPRQDTGRLPIYHMRVAAHPFDRSPSGDAELSRAITAALEPEVEWEPFIVIDESQS